MTDPVYDLLSKLSLTAHNSEDLLFPSPFSSRKSVDIRSAWERILRQGNIEGATFHTIRHTTCSLLASLGIPSILIAIKDDIAKASKRIGLTDFQADNLWQALQEIQKNNPKSNVSAGLLYFGAGIAFLSMTWFYTAHLTNGYSLLISIA